MYFSEPEINENEYNFLKSLDSKWKWFMKLEDENIFVYEIDPWGKGNWSNSNTKVENFDIDKGLFNDIPNDDSISYSISKMINDYDTKISDSKNMELLKEMFPTKKENKNGN